MANSAWWLPSKKCSRGYACMTSRQKTAHPDVLVSNLLENGIGRVVLRAVVQQLAEVKKLLTVQEQLGNHTPGKEREHTHPLHNHTHLCPKTCTCRWQNIYFKSETKYILAHVCKYIIQHYTILICLYLYHNSSRVTICFFQNSNNNDCTIHHPGCNQTLEVLSTCMQLKRHCRCNPSPSLHQEMIFCINK